MDKIVELVGASDEDVDERAEEGMMEIDIAESLMDDCCDWGDGSPNFLYYSIDGKPNTDVAFAYDSLKGLDLEHCSEEDVKKAVLSELDENLSEDCSKKKLDEKIPDSLIRALRKNYSLETISHECAQKGLDLDKSDFTEITKEQAVEDIEKGEGSKIIVIIHRPPEGAEAIVWLGEVNTRRGPSTVPQTVIGQIVQAEKFVERENASKGRFYTPSEMKCYKVTNWVDYKQDWDEKTQGVHPVGDYWYRQKKHGHPWDWERKRDRELRAGADKYQDGAHYDGLRSGSHSMNRYRASLADLQKNMVEYRRLKYNLNRAARELERSKEEKKWNVASLKKDIEQYKSKIKEMEKYLNDAKKELKDLKSGETQKELQAKYDGLRADIDALLRKSPATPEVAAESFEEKEPKALSIAEALKALKSK